MDSRLVRAVLAEYEQAIQGATAAYHAYLAKAGAAHAQAVKDYEQTVALATQAYESAMRRATKER